MISLKYLNKSSILYIITIPATNCKKIWFFFLKKKLDQRIGAWDQKMGTFSAICNFGMIASINLKFFKNVLGYHENVLHKFGFYSKNKFSNLAQNGPRIWDVLAPNLGILHKHLKAFIQDLNNIAFSTCGKFDVCSITFTDIIDCRSLKYHILRKWHFKRI